MTDEEVTQAVRQIKATASPAGGALAERLGDEIRRLRLSEAGSVITNDAFLMVQEKDRQEIARLRSVIAKVRALHPAQFTRADVMKILKEGDS